MSHPQEPDGPRGRGMRVLLVDDDPRLQGYLPRGLGEHGIECACATDAEEAARLLEVAAGAYDLVLLDVMMPGRSGWDLLEEIRGKGDATPVIFLTARQAVEERIRGLRLGADDYVLKPFSLGELLARIEAVRRRAQASARLEVAGLVLDPVHRLVERGGVRIEMSPREFELLHALAESAGHVLSRSELLKRVWGTDSDPSTNVVDVAVARLRRRLERGSAPPVLHTVVGQGYRLGDPAAER